MDANRMMDISCTLSALHTELVYRANYLAHLCTELDVYTDAECQSWHLTANTAKTNIHNALNDISRLSVDMHNSSIMKVNHNDHLE